MQAKVLLAAALGLNGVGMAAPSVEHWSGHGRLYDQDRTEISRYDLDVYVEDVAPGLQAVSVRVTVDGRVVHENQCQLRLGDERWRKTCDDGEGGGYWFAFGLGSEYYETRDGKAYATQIIRDGDRRMRLVRTELQGIEATKFFAEELTKVNGGQ